MKKVLFSTTALAAASMLAFSASDAQAGSHSKAKPLSIKVGGFMKAAVGFSEQDGSFESTTNSTARASYDAFNQYNDSEIYFTGSTKLDNGITASVTVQLEADQVKNGTQIDASYMRLTGGFGDLRLGSGSYASAMLSNKAPWTGAMNPHGSDYSAWIVKPAANSLSAVQGTSIGGGDNMKVAWISPTISGLRLGLSYEPSGTNSDKPPATMAPMSKFMTLVSITQPKWVALMLKRTWLTLKSTALQPVQMLPGVWAQQFPPVELPLVVAIWMLTTLTLAAVV